MLVRHHKRLREVLPQAGSSRFAVEPRSRLRTQGLIPQLPGSWPVRLSAELLSGHCLWPEQNTLSQGQPTSSDQSMQMYKGPPLALTQASPKGCPCYQALTLGPGHVLNKAEQILKSESTDSSRGVVCSRHLLWGQGGGGAFTERPQWSTGSGRSQGHRIQMHTPGVSLSHIYCMSLNIFICKLEVTLARASRKLGGKKRVKGLCEWQCSFRWLVSLLTDMRYDQRHHFVKPKVWRLLIQVN